MRCRRGRRWDVIFSFSRPPSTPRKRKENVNGNVKKNVRKPTYVDKRKRSKKRKFLALVSLPAPCSLLSYDDDGGGGDGGDVDDDGDGDGGDDDDGLSFT